jgi:hypothetical protein
VKIYLAAAVDAQGKRKRHDETQFTTKIAGKTKLIWVPIIYFAL